MGAAGNPNPLPTNAVRTADGDTVMADQFNHWAITIGRHKQPEFQYGVTNVPGQGPNQLYGPYTAFRIGDYTRQTPSTNDILTVELGPSVRQIPGGLRWPPESLLARQRPSRRWYAVRNEWPGRRRAGSPRGVHVNRGRFERLMLWGSVPVVPLAQRAGRP